MNLSYPLSVAIRANNVDRLLELLKQGASPNSVITCTPVLFQAADEGHIEMVKILLQSGADVNKACTDSGATPLYAAAKEGRNDIVNILLKSGAEVNSTNTTGATPLYIASQRGHMEVVKTLLSSGADPFINCNSITQREVSEMNNRMEMDSCNSLTPREVAEMNNHMDIVNLLTEYELSWNQKVKISTPPKSQELSESNVSPRVMHISTQDKRVKLPPLSPLEDNTPLSIQLNPHEDIALLVATRNSVQGSAQKQVQVPSDSPLTHRYCFNLFSAT